ncbi:hypothetical protein NMG60_11029353 [Bertholletia excelsa]
MAPSFDISMSRRTRRASILLEEDRPSPMKPCSPEKNSLEKAAQKPEAEKLDKEEEMGDPKTSSDDEAKAGAQEKPSNGEEVKSHKSLELVMRDADGKGFSRGGALEQNLTQATQLQLVVVRPHEVNLKRMMGRYARVMSHLMKTRRDPRLVPRTKPAPNCRAEVRSCG